MLIVLVYYFVCFLFVLWLLVFNSLKFGVLVFLCWFAGCTVGFVFVVLIMFGAAFL